MARNRLSLHTIFEELIDSKNVYYRPPENTKMKYPCIRYNRVGILSEHANNALYLKMNRYLITVIDPNPDNPVIEKILGLPMCEFDRHYESDNLNHDVLILYY